MGTSRQCRRMTRGAGIVLALVAGLALPVVHGGTKVPDGDKPMAAGATSEPAAKKGWGERVFDVYQSGLKEIVAALEKAPPAAEALPKAKAIKQKCIEALVPLGREREAMDASAKAQGQSQLMMKMMGLDRSDTYKAYAKLVGETYSVAKMKTPEEKELSKIITDMNIITQYAHFELLKKQDPKEAERLGIK